MRSAGRASAAAGPVPARFFSLRLRLLGLVALVLLPWLALVLYTQADERKAAIAQVNADALRLIRIVTSNQAAQIEAARQLLAALVRLPQLRTRDASACSGFLADMLKAYPLYLNVGVVEPDGNIVCSAVPLRTQVNIADRAYFRRALATRAFVLGDYQIGRITQLPSINYAQPVLDAAGNVQVVVFVAQSLSWLTVALGEVKLPPDAILSVTDRNATVLARVPQFDGWIGSTLPERPVIATMLTRPEGGVFEADDAQGVRRLWAYAPLIAGLGVDAIIGVPEAVAFADIDRRLKRNLAALGLVTGIALAAAWIGGKLVLRQVNALVLATGKLASGDLGARAPSRGGGSELDLLARAFNSMAATLQTRDRDLRVAEERTRAAEIELAVTRAHLDIARQIQQSLLPQGPLALAGVRVAGRCVPAVAVGGDYFGYFPSGRNGIDSFIGDVSGHGVGAALLMAEARTTFMAQRLIAPGAAGMLARLNELLHDDLDRAGLFMTACCATFDATTRELAYANAGHPPALLLRADQTRCTPVSANGVLLGIRKHAQFDEVKLSLRTGDIAVFYTDGITETQDQPGNLFGAERLGEVVAAHRGEDPEGIIDAVLSSLDQFAGATQHEDDQTIVVMKLTS